MKFLFLYPVLLVILLQLTIVDSKLSIVSPHQLAAQFPDETIPFVLAKYGNAPYGAHFVGGLALAKQPEQQGFGCSKIEHFQAGEIQFDQNIIAVIPMGICQATVKTRNAQLAGAKMVILVQDTDEPLPEVFGSAVGTDNIHIPTILISKAHGERLIKFIEKLPYPPLNPEDIIPIVSINFPYDAKSDVVALDFWMTSSDASGYDFLSNFGSHVAQNLGAFNFTPHFVTWDCFICKRTNYRVQATDDCISAGRYCAPDPDESGPLKGRDILLEDIRQKCAWKANHFVWWNYIEAYRTQCRNKADVQKCSLNAFGGHSDSIENCVIDSFVGAGGGMKTGDDKVDDNRILAGEKELQLEYDITEFPVLLINHKPFTGDLQDMDEVLTEICRNVNNPTGECKKYALLGSSGQTSHQTGPDAEVIILVVIMLMISGGLIVFLFRRMHKRKEAMEMSMEANNMVSRYMAVRDLPTARDGDEENESHA